MSFYIGLSFLSNREKNLKRKLSAEGMRILSCLKNITIDENEITRNENGRPYLPGSSGDFNISHSGVMAAVSLVTDNGQRTGCDIQIEKQNLSVSEIAGDFFTVPERDYIFESRSGKSRFFEIWTLKECYLKLQGLSVFNMASAPSFINGGHFTFNGASPPLSFYLYELTANEERYFLAAAIEGAQQHQPEIRWFSESFFPCRSIAKIKAAVIPTRTVSPNI